MALLCGFVALIKMRCDDSDARAEVSLFNGNSGSMAYTLNGRRLPLNGAADPSSNTLVLPPC